MTKRKETLLARFCAAGMGKLVLAVFLTLCTAGGSLVAQTASAQAERPKPGKSQPLARHAGSPFDVFDALVASQHGLAAAQKATAQHGANIPEGMVTFDVPASDGYGTMPAGVNLAGVVTGNYYDSNYVSHGFVRNADGTFTTFDAPGAGTVPNDSNGTFPLGINLFGTVAGYYNDANLVSHCFIRTSNGDITTFDVPGADINPADEAGSIIAAINDGGVVAGYYEDSSFVSHGYLRSPGGKFTDFDAPGSATYGTFVLAMNVEAATAGHYTNSNYLYISFVRNPDGSFASFIGPEACENGILDGCVGGGVHNINASGTSTGSYQTVSGDILAFVRSREGTLTTFEAPDAGTGSSQGTGCYCWWGTNEGLSDWGAVTGTYLDANNVFHGFLRKPAGTFVEFDAPGADLTPGDYNGTVPDSMNDFGVITGFYVDASFIGHGFVFTSR